MPREVVHLLWTGGWDSTYRLLDLVLSRGEPVQPHYVLDENRRSSEHELRAQTEIRRALPEPARRLVAPTRVTTLSEIPRPDRFQRAFDRLVDRTFLGRQYEWLPAYCRQAGVREMELAVHVDDTAHAVLADHVVKDGDSWVVDPSLEGRPMYELFQWFRFPLLRMSKVEMKAAAEAAGFEHLMRLTWFCHRPRGGDPCGTCNPCIYTIEEGMSHRIPLRSRIRYHLRVMPRVKKIIRRDRHPRLYRGAKKVQALLERFRRWLKGGAS